MRAAIVWRPTLHSPSWSRRIETVATYQIAQVYAWRGETEKAFEWLQIAFNNHDTGMLSLLIDPLMRGLHHDARYKGLLAKIGLPLRL